MIANAVDTVVSWFAPHAALRRMHARQVLNRGYESAKAHRLRRTVASNLSADSHLLHDADSLRAEARRLVRDNAYAKGVIRAATRNIIGTGIKPQCRVERRNGDQNEKFNQLAEKAWKRWQSACDVTGQLSFAEILRLIISERWEAGEVLVRFVRIDDQSRFLPFAIELIDADRLASEYDVARRFNVSQGNEIRRGIELDAMGRPVAYYLYDHHPNEVNSHNWEIKRVPASEVIHLFRVTRVGQTRGVTEFAPVLSWMEKTDRYVDHEITSSAIASCFSVAIKSVDGSGTGIAPPAGSDTSDSSGNSFDHVEPGMVARLFPDEDISVINPARGQSEAQAWINLMLRSMGVGTGLSYERLTRDYSQTNYSSNRASDLEDRREFRSEQQWIIDRFCIPVWKRFISECVRAELPGFPTAFDLLRDIDRWMEHIWQPPGWEWVDPTKEVAASIDAIENDLSTLEEEVAKRGNRDWRDVLAQRAREKQLKKELEADGDEEETPDDPKEEQPAESVGDDVSDGEDRPGDGESGDEVSADDAGDGDTSRHLRLRADGSHSGSDPDGRHATAEAGATAGLAPAGVDSEYVGVDS